jgi:multidrug efflux pump subunit AcrB
MRPIPGRSHFAALTEAARAIGPVATLGFASTVDDGQKAPLQSISSIVYDMRTEKLQRRNQFRTITISTYAHEAEHDRLAPDAIVAPAV